MDEKDRQLLNLIQAEFPLVQRPFYELGQRLNLSEEDVLLRIKKLKNGKIIRQISAIFDTRALGYQSSLVAMKIEQNHIDESAAIINSHPGVSHNYARKAVHGVTAERSEHEFNLWFTIAVPPSHDLQKTIDRLHQLAKADVTRPLPALKVFKIGVKLDLTGENPIDARRDNVQDRVQSISETASEEHRRLGVFASLSAYFVKREEILAIRQLQENIVLTYRPFDAMAERAGMTVEQLLLKAKQFHQSGQMRRFAAVLHHRKAGFSANAMVVWKAPEERIDEVGAIMSSFDAVSHCYQRPTYPDWPYALFTMVHGREKAECEQILSAISEETGLTDYMALYSVKEYKKTRARYFTEEFDEWEKRYL